MSRLTVRGVRKTYGAVVALDGVDLEVQPGGSTAVVGASGCGKTSLLRVIAGFETPDDGTVTVSGRDLRAVPPHRRNIGYVAQDGALFPHLTVGQNIAYGLARGERNRVPELLDMVALESDYAARRPHELSGGQQQRVALARALARRPELMLLDEPFSALDAGLRAATRKAVAAALRAAGVTSVLVTHDQEEALSFADQVAVMRAGRFTQVGSPEQVYAAPADLFTAGFLGDCVLLDGTVRDGVAECVLGRIPVRDNDFAGRARLLLRPEQIVAQAASNGAAAGVVVASDFLGSDVLLGIDLFGSDTSISVRQASVVAPAKGTNVTLTVLGAAVAFPA